MARFWLMCRSIWTTCVNGICLVYYVASKVGLDLPIYQNINDRPDLTKLMALCAAGISGGSIVMHHLLGITPEAPSIKVASGRKKAEV